MTAGVEEAGCSASVSIGSASATYTVDEMELEGSWSAVTLAGDYSIALQGSRAATLEITTVRAGTTTYDAEWELTGLAATTTDFTVDSMTLDVTYTGFGDLTWDVDLVWQVGVGWTGMVEVSDAGSCSVGGTLYAPTVTCAPASAT